MPTSPTDDDLVQRFLSEVCAPLRAHDQSDYTRLDRYRDFRTVFGTTEGKRVLRQIIDTCEGAKPPSPEASPQRLAAYVAGKHIAHWILATAMVPPREA